MAFNGIASDEAGPLIFSVLPIICLRCVWLGVGTAKKTARIYVTDALSQLTEISASLATRQRWLMLAKKARPNFSFDLWPLPFPPLSVQAELSFWSPHSILAQVTQTWLPVFTALRRRQGGVDKRCLGACSASAGGGTQEICCEVPVSLCVWVCCCSLASGWWNTCWNRVPGVWGALVCLGACLQVGINPNFWQNSFEA